jgi:hypothetical protein
MKGMFDHQTVFSGKVWLMALTGLALSVPLAGAQTAITVTNASFESPVLSGSPYFQTLPADDGSVGKWLGYGTFSAVVKSGGPNAYNVSPTGIVGSQFGDQSAKIGTGVFQDLTSYTGGNPNQLWAAGIYTLTVGFFSRADDPVPAVDTLDMKLFWRTSRTAGTTILGDTQILGSQVNTASLTDFTLNVTINPGDAAIGHPIGIWFDSTSSDSGGLGDWGYDNVRLSFTPAPAPEPTTLALLGLGTLFGFRRRLHR